MKDGRKGPLPKDYEVCGDCGFDHSYEPQESADWHRANMPKKAVILQIHPGSPPYCDVEVDGIVYQGIAMVIGPNGWVPATKCLLEKMYP